ncbi:YciI family protein [Pseudonocardia benzenivorans]|uniref:YCII-related protein n=2 Tax=Pseudonocardia TaxID=1847 RepID=F4CPT9_PSEUX|nr:YciI family protein [Pseudonocardia dioxanivorans]AEA26122.1 YCII-related protein [Pseudonocardia dioxanivorans CB1190]GJF02905.1 hypothetical protein PSD17_18670 [Pseudonocardia sp. D17]
MRYMLLIYGCERYEPGTPGYEDTLVRIGEYTRELREQGVFLAADPLHPIETATTVRVRDGDVLVTDGPFAESVEALGGYFVLECRDLDQALELAARCPLAERGCIEVRPIRDLMPDGSTVPVALAERPGA